MSTKLFVGNLAFATTEDEIRDAFSAHGDVTDVFVAFDKFTGRPRGFAFVTMGSAEAATSAVEAMNGAELGGRNLTVNEARPKEDRPPRNFGGGGDRGRGGFGGGRGDRRGGGGGGRGGYGGGRGRRDDRY